MSIHHDKTCLFWTFFQVVLVKWCIYNLIEQIILTTFYVTITRV